MSVVVVSVVSGASGSARQAPVAAISMMTCAQVAPLIVELKLPKKRITVAEPIAFSITRTFPTGTTIHTYEFLLGPHEGNGNKASGWFIDKPNEPLTFYLEEGYVYVTHTTSEPVNAGNTATATTTEVTRPRVRTRRVLAQGEGTIFLVQAFELEERFFALDFPDPAPNQPAFKLKLTSLLKENEATIREGFYRNVIDDGSLESELETDDSPALEQLVDDIKSAAGNFELELP